MSGQIVFAARKAERYRGVIDMIANGDDSDVTVVEDGYACLDAVVTRPPAAALIDIGLQGMPIRELRRRIRQSSFAVSGTAVVFGHAEDARIRTVTSRGMANGYIPVPCTDESFINCFLDVREAHARRAVLTLNPVQKSLLKLSRHCLDGMSRAVAAGEPPDAAQVNELCNSLVAAARSDELVGVLNALRTHHNYTFVHVLRVASAMTVFGHQLGMRSGDLMRMAQAGLLHDLGKLAISNSILCKPGPLSEEEWVIMKQHPKVSVDILSREAGFSADTLNAAHNHHERIDGTGYPRGLKGGQIDDLSLVCGIADVFSALTEKRSYKPRLSQADALVIMRDMSGNHLEPSFFARFEELAQAGLIV